MARMFGREWTRRELLERVGDLAQVAGADAFTYTDGVREGVRATRGRTGGGPTFTVLHSRGLDISHAAVTLSVLDGEAALGAARAAVKALLPR